VTHGTADPGTIVVEQEVEGASSTTGRFLLPNIMVLKARHGQIAHLRDYANLLAVEEAAGSPNSPTTSRPAGMSTRRSSPRAATGSGISASAVTR
jgi:hypothetical protein